MKTETDMEKLYEDFQKLYKEGAEKIRQATDIIVAFEKTATPEELELFSQYILKRLRQIITSSSNKSVNDLLPNVDKLTDAFAAFFPKKDDLN